MKILLLALLASKIIVGTCQANPLVTFPIEINGKSLRVEIANTEKSRLVGLMYRKKLGTGRGMIFIYKKEKKTAMWMKNTLIPLSVAFIDKNGEILNIEKMEPLDLTHHQSHGPAKYSLEVNQGWFTKHGVRPGDRLRGLDQLPAAQ